MCYILLESGNGRVCREFIRQIAYSKGYKLNLNKTNPKELLDATIKSTTNTKDLENIIYKALESI